MEKLRIVGRRVAKPHHHTTGPIPDRLFRLALVVAALVLSLPSVAADRPLYSRFHIVVGGFFPTVETEARLDGQLAGDGTEINFDSELGLEENVSSPRLGLLWRFTQRSGLSFNYFDLKREGTDTVNINIKWGDIEIPANTEVRSKFNTEVFTLSYTYAFVQRPNWELAVSGGLHVTRFDVAIEPVAAPDEGDGGAATAPLPVVGLVGGFDFAKRWSLIGTSRFFALKVGDYEGSITEFSAFAQYAFSKHVGIAAGLDFFETDVDSSADDFQGRLRWRYFGPGVYLTFF